MAILHECQRCTACCRWTGDVRLGDGAAARITTFPGFEKRCRAIPSLVSADESDAPLELPIDGVLDLHPFRPQDVKVVLTEYLMACRERGILEVRVIHGKGIGEVRRTVHVLLGWMPDVDRYALAGEHYGGSGATMVRLKPV